MKEKSINFLLKLGAIIVLSFGIHLIILYFSKNDLFGNQIILSYFVNYLLAVVVLFAVEKSLAKNSSQAGFVFMAGSGLKFLVFFLVFYPNFKSDGKMQTLEFAAFFIPYLLCLVAEVAYLSKTLNNQST